jgi:hypothetical protein
VSIVVVIQIIVFVLYNKHQQQQKHQQHPFFFKKRVSWGDKTEKACVLKFLLHVKRVLLHALMRKCMLLLVYDCNNPTFSNVVKMMPRLLGQCQDICRGQCQDICRGQCRGQDHTKVIGPGSLLNITFQMASIAKHCCPYCKNRYQGPCAVSGHLA